MIPIVTIAEGWSVDDVQTEEDCEDAFAYLTGAIVSIEAQMDELAMRGEEQSIAYIRAKSALRWKKAAMSIVNSKKGRINRLLNAKMEAERAKRFDIIQAIRRIAPDVWARALEEVKEHK